MQNHGRGGEEKENSTVQQHCRNSLINVTQGVFAFVKDSATKRKQFTSKTLIYGDYSYCINIFTDIFLSLLTCIAKYCKITKNSLARIHRLSRAKPSQILSLKCTVQCPQGQNTLQSRKQAVAITEVSDFAPTKKKMCAN